MTTHEAIEVLARHIDAAPATGNRDSLGNEWPSVREQIETLSRADQFHRDVEAGKYTHEGLPGHASFADHRAPIAKVLREWAEVGNVPAEVAAIVL